MDLFYPFIYEPKKKEVFEPLPLYIELVQLPEEETELQEEETVIIIDIY